MAVINCPHCQGKLKFPDDSPARKVKCPACGQSFLAGPKGPITDEGSSKTTPRKEEPAKPPAKKEEVAEDFEVVDDKKSSRTKSRDDDDRDRKSRDEEDDRDRKRRDDDDDNRDRRKRDDDDDRPRSKRGSRDDDDDDRDRDLRKRDDDDDDRPRSKRGSRDDDDDDRERNRRKRDDDDDDDRPRSRRGSRDDDDDDRPRSKRGRDDDDDDRPRSKRGRDDDDDDEVDDKKKNKAVATQWKNSRQGVFLIGIGFWCQVGALGITVFTLFLFFVAGEYVEELYIPAGLAGLANWILGGICFGFLIAGFKKGNIFGLSIALTCVAGLHLFMVLYLSFQKETSFYGSRGTATIHWSAIPTQLDQMTSMLVSSTFVTASLICALLELARFILFVLIMKEIGAAAKDRDVSKSAGMQLITLPGALGISLILFLIARMIMKNSSMGSEGKYFVFLLLLIQYGGYIAVYVLSALMCSKAKDAIAYRKK